MDASDKYGKFHWSLAERHQISRAVRGHMIQHSDNSRLCACNEAALPEKKERNCIMCGMPLKHPLHSTISIIITLCTIIIG